MGDVAPELVPAAFAVFNPEEIVPLAKRGHELADAATMWAARLDGAAAQLRRILGPEPAGAAWVTERLLRSADDLPLSGWALFAGQRAQAMPDEPIARLWRSADRLREFRGDSHIQVWLWARFDPTEHRPALRPLLGGCRAGPTPPDAAGRPTSSAPPSRTASRPLVSSTRSDSPTAAAREREQIEAATDAAMTAALNVLGNDIDHILTTLEPWGAAIRAAGGHLPRWCGSRSPHRDDARRSVGLGYLDVTRRHVMYVVTSIPSTGVVGELKTADSPSNAT